MSRAGRRDPPPRRMHRDPVRDGQHLAELVADEHHAPAVRRSSSGAFGKSSTPRGRAPRSARPSDQDPGPAVEQLEDLDPLLLADRQVARSPRLWFEFRETELIGQLERPRHPYLREVQCGSVGLGRSPSSYVLGDGLGDGTSVKCWWTIPRPGPDRVARRAKFGGRPVDEDWAGVWPVEPRPGCS